MEDEDNDDDDEDDEEEEDAAEEVDGVEDGEVVAIDNGAEGEAAGDATASEVVASCAKCSNIVLIAVRSVDDRKSTNKLKRGTDDKARNWENTRWTVAMLGGCDLKSSAITINNGPSNDSKSPATNKRNNNGGSQSAK